MDNICWLQNWYGTVVRMVVDYTKFTNESGVKMVWMWYDIKKIISTDNGNVLVNCKCQLLVITSISFIVT